MSLLDRTIALVSSQIAVLTAAAKFVEGRPGTVVDIGLGNGRVYDHLRECLPDRDIFAFDESLKAATASVPPADKLILGDIRDTAPYVMQRMGQPAVLIHCDIATADSTANLARSHWLPRCLAHIAAEDAVIVSRLALDAPEFAVFDPKRLGLDAAAAERAGSLLYIYSFDPAAGASGRAAGEVQREWGGDAR